MLSFFLVFLFLQSITIPACIAHVRNSGKGDSVKNLAFWISSLEGDLGGKNCIGVWNLSLHCSFHLRHLRHVSEIFISICSLTVQG